MFHQRTVKTLVVILLVPLMAFGGLVGFFIGLVTGVGAWLVIEKVMPKPDWYDHEDEKAGFTRLDIRSPDQSLPKPIKGSLEIGKE